MTDRPAPLHDILGHAPIIAILRGLAPEEASDTAMALHQAGIRLLEVPLNGARATETIARLVAAAPPASWIGAGTVVDGRELTGTPRTSAAATSSPPISIPRSLPRRAPIGLASIIGVATPSEAFRALACGATMLKMFPAEQMSPAVLKAWRAVLPPGTALIPVGGVTPETAPAWLAAGAAGVALGSALYSPSRQPRLAAAALAGCAHSWPAGSARPALGAGRIAR